MKISVRKSLQKNKFWVHHIYINKNNTIDYPAGDENSKTGLLVNSDSDMITQDNNNVKSSKDVAASASSLLKENKKLAEMVDYRKRMSRLSKQTDYKRSDVRKKECSEQKK